MKDNLPAYMLMIKQHYLTLSPDEEMELAELLRQDPSLLELQVEVQRIPKEEAMSFLQSIEPSAEWEAIVQRSANIERTQKTRKRVAIASAAAAAVLFLIITFQMRDTRKTEITSLPSSDQALILMLGNGERLVMNDTGKQVLRAGDYSVQNNNRTLSFQGQTVQGKTELNTLNVPNKLDFQIELSDGTKVWLNSTTQFRFSFSFPGSTREVYIDRGEAYFSVAKDTKPFIVHTPSGSVKVLGTEFNVNAYNENKIVTSLINGKVAVTHGHEISELKPGAEAVIENGQITQRNSFDIENTISWRQGIHYFESATVEEVGIMLKRWFNTDLHIDNVKAASIEIRGKLNRNLPLEVFLDQVNNLNLVNFYWVSGELHCK